MGQGLKPLNGEGEEAFAIDQGHKLFGQAFAAQGPKPSA